MKNFFYKLFINSGKLFLIFCFLNLSWALLRTIVKLPVRLNEHTAVLPILGGFVLCLLLMVAGFRFIRMYVFGHELTHYLTAKLFLRKTGGFKVSKEGGSVAVDKPNVWIVLAPYFVPLYSIIWIGGYGVVRIFKPNVPEWGLILFFGGVGATYAFHLLMTLYALSKGQSDIKIYGKVFSLSLILSCNLFVLFLTVAIASGRFSHGFSLLWKHIQDQAELTWYFCTEICSVVKDVFGRIKV